MLAATAEHILILDTGTGTGHRLLRRLRELGVFSLVVRPSTAPDSLAQPLPSGVIIVNANPAAGVAAADVWRATGLPALTVTDSPSDDKLRTFLFITCGCRGGWTPEGFANAAVDAIARRVGQGRVVAGLSGGVDSSVAAALVQRAIGPRLTCIFVDHGLLRLGEAVEVPQLFRDLGWNLVQVDASTRFLATLAGVTDPEEKRHRIGGEFVRVFEGEARRLGAIDFLLQGTLYPDVLESGALTDMAIKTHHNVGALPSDMELQLLEPLRYLFKDEVRRIGAVLGLPRQIIERQPFPGPGLAIRILGAVTRERLANLRRADAIVREEISRAGLANDIWQFFAVLPGARAVGTIAGERTYGEAVIVRAVTGRDAVTADWARLPHGTLARLSERLLAEVPGITRVAYDITAKPPGTIEWE